MKGLRDNLSFTNSKQQQITAKMRYSKTLAGHQKFLNTYLKQKDKDHVIEKPVIFGNISEEEYKKKMHRKNVYAKNGKKIKTISNNFKWILSPEKKLTDEQFHIFTEKFILELEKETGKKYDWQAAIHRDTPHPHVHVLINGLDQNGKLFRFNKEVVKNTARKICQDILTEQLGERDIELIQAARERQFTDLRYTDYDKEIYEELKPVKETEYDGKIKTNDFRLIRRLEFLYDQQLADFRNNEFYIKKRTKENLKANGRYNKFLTMKKEVEKQGYNLTLYKTDMGDIQGKVYKCFNMNDEDIWNNSFVVMNEKKRAAYFIPVFNEMDNIEGSTVHVRAKENQKGLLTPDVDIIDY